MPFYFLTLLLLHVLVKLATTSRLNDLAYESTRSNTAAGDDEDYGRMPHPTINHAIVHIASNPEYIALAVSGGDDSPPLPVLISDDRMPLVCSTPAVHNTQPCYYTRGAAQTYTIQVNSSVYVVPSDAARTHHPSTFNSSTGDGDDLHVHLESFCIVCNNDTSLNPKQLPFELYRQVQRQLQAVYELARAGLANGSLVQLELVIDQATNTDFRRDWLVSDGAWKALRENGTVGVDVFYKMQQQPQGQPQPIYLSPEYPRVNVTRFVNFTVDPEIVYKKCRLRDVRCWFPLIPNHAAHLTSRKMADTAVLALAMALVACVARFG